MESQGMILAPAITVKTMSGFNTFDYKLFEGKTMRQLGLGQMDDEGHDISGHRVAADAVAAVLIDDIANACRWANDKMKLNIEIAPSLTCVDSGNVYVSFLELT